MSTTLGAEHTPNALADDAAAAYAFRQLVAHLQERKDVQNIEMMILAGFCRNCLSKWYHVGAAKAGLSTSYEEACERVYGMSYSEWKKSYQSKASEEQLARMEETKALHAKHEKAPPPATKAVDLARPEPTPTPTPPPRTAQGGGGGGMSDVCCVPEDELVPVAGAPAAPTPAPRPPPPALATPIRIDLGILTVSDRVAAGVYADQSGPEIRRTMEAFAASPAGACWELAIAGTAAVPDEGADIARVLRAWSDAPPASAEEEEEGAPPPLPPLPPPLPPPPPPPCCNLILTTGGTGLAPRDVTPEATAALLDVSAPGIPELLLREAVKHEPLAALSRGTAGVRGRTLIVNLPGRPKAVRENLAVLMPLLSHALAELRRRPSAAAACATDGGGGAARDGGDGGPPGAKPMPPPRYVSFDKLDRAL